MNRQSAILFLLVLSLTSSAQVDTGFNANRILDEIVVTGTRTERKLSNVAVPTAVISSKTIKLSGSLRLNDILQEQTGLFITSGTGSNAVGGGVFGNGVQLQGLSPDHTLILLDGEPLIGRQGGVMDLSRFAVGNIRKIEMVKGPSSSLYGSDAMGGVINIITDPLPGNNFNAGIRTGSFLNTDVYTSGNTIDKKLSIYYFLNRNSSNGYELDKTTPEKTLDPYYNYTGQLKLTYRFTTNSKLMVNGRGFYGNQQSRYAINSPALNINGNGRTKDFIINPVFTHRFNNQLQTNLRFLVSGYQFTQQLDSIENKRQYYFDQFRQDFYRAEDQTDYSWNERNTLSVGAGFTLQTVNTTRYSKQQQQQMWHAFAQHEWKGIKNLTLISGLRYDYNTDFAARLSPKLAAHYKINEKIKLTGSYGAGFKAPDFRQLYLNFTNNAAEGYSIYGSNEFSMPLLQQQQSIGLIATILPAASLITQLQPEISKGFNLGTQLQFFTSFKMDINLFRNDVSNLINYIPVATHPNGTSVFSYINVNRAYTQGAEMNISYKLAAISISGGYQFLQTADKDELQKVNNKKVYGRDEVNGSARLMTRADYSGLLNRSKHMANLRLFWQQKSNKWNASLRFIYRSRFGVTDRDGNGFANMKEEYAPAMFQANMTVGYQLSRSFSLQGGVNNLFNQVNARYMSNIPGINWFTGLHYSFKK
jgi:outer membrane receptor for ferrienterochelin and colicins